MAKEILVVEKMARQLELIKDENIQSLVIKALMKAPASFWTEAASSTGKHHPRYAHGEGGLLRHVQAAVYFANEITSLEMFEVSDRTRDIIIAAVILHDCCKRGVDGSAKYAHEHPLLVRELLDEDSLNEEEKRVWNKINELISSHMGQWTTSKFSEVVLPKPESLEQKIVHLSDYLASREPVSVEIFGDEYKDKAEPRPIRVELVRPATEKQKNYISVLIKKAKALPDYDPKWNDLEVDELTIGQASSVIGKLVPIVEDEKNTKE